MILLAWLAACSPPDDPAPARKKAPEPVVEVSEHTTPVLPTQPIDTDTAELTDTAEPEPDPGAVLFDDAFVHDIDFLIDEVAAQRLRDRPDGWQEATFVFDGVEVAEVGVRLKGNGSFQPFDDKPSWKVSLDRFVPDQELDGLDQLVLNNMGTDASMIRERMAYRAYQLAGIPAPRTAYARVTVNGEERGTYLMVEDADRRFLRRWYEDSGGSLYEMFDVEFFSAQVPDFDHDGGPDDRRPLYALCDVLDDPSQRLVDEGSEVLDVEQFAAYLAVSAVLGQFDAYPYSVPGDDIYLYVDPTDGRIDTLPHGADEVFSDPHRPVDYVFGRLGLACMEEPICKQRFSDAVWHTLELLETENYTQQVSDEWEAMVAHRRPAPGLPNAARDRDRLMEFLTTRRKSLESMPGL